MPDTLEFDIPQMAQTWSLVREIRDRVREHLAGQPADVREHAAMTVSELAENAVKYGVAVPEAPLAHLQVVVSGDTLCIEVKSGIGDTAATRAVLDTIASLDGQDDARALYEQRIAELLDDAAGDESRLGLLRIAHEGAFHLEGVREGNTLLVRATRKLGDG